MLVAFYNRTFEEEHIHTIVRLIKQMEKSEMRLLFYEEFWQRIRPFIQLKNEPGFFTGKQNLPAQTDMFFSLGGDGTMLDSVTFVGASGIPLIGINLGRLGFLAAIHDEGIDLAVQSLIRGDYTLEQRSLIHLDSSTGIFRDMPFALNEFTLHRKDSSSMIKIHTYLNGEFLNTYWADGLIVATPTGSTGYSLSCGGPVVFPQTGSFVITPVAPHNLSTRPIIVPDSNVISFEIEGRADHFLCTLDARTETITSNIQLAVRKEQFEISLVRPSDHNFLETLRQKLYWGVDRRN